MAKLEIILDKADGRYTAGETIIGKAVLILDKQVKYRKILARLIGTEATVVGSGKHRSSEENTLVESTIVLKEESNGMLNPGTYELPPRLSLPPGLPPTYEGNDANVSYEMTAWADIPLWFDLKCSKEISVIQKPQDTPQSAPINFSSKTLNTQKPSFSVSIENSVLRAGQTLQGKITVFNPQSSGITKATIKIFAVEQAKAHYATSVSNIPGAECNVPAKELVYGAQKEFSIKVPDDAPPTYTSKLSSLQWFIEANLDLPWRFDVKEGGSITILQNQQKPAEQ